MTGTVSAGSSGLAAGGLMPVVTAVKTSAYTANPGEFVPVSTSGGAVTVTLPTAPADGTTISVKMVAQASTNAVTIACGGADTINVAMSGPTSGTLTLLNQAVTLQYSAPIAVWYVLDDSLALSQLDARYGKLSGATFTGIVNLNAGSDTAASAPVLTALGSVSGTAIQLADLTRDYVVYLEVTTAGTATSLTIGHTSAANDVSIMTSAAATAGQVISFRLPAGWWFKWTGTTTAMGNQNAVGC